jgi:hypothetical protein
LLIVYNIVATPHVSGVAALVWSHFVSLPASEIRELLEYTAIDLGVPGRDDEYGNGLVDTKAAFDFLFTGSTFHPTSSPTSFTCPIDQSTLVLVIEPDDYPDETSWTLEQTCSSTLLYEGDSTGTVLCLEYGLSHTLTIHDSYGDGMCAGFGTGKYTIYYNGKLVKEGCAFGFSESTFLFGGEECDTMPPSTSASPSTIPSVLKSEAPSKSPSPSFLTPSPSVAPSITPTQLSCGSGQKKFTLVIIQDTFFAETRWTLENCSGEKLLEGDYHGDDVCLEASNGYNFTIYDSFGDGICSDYENSYISGRYELLLDGEIIKEGCDFNYIETTLFGDGCGLTESEVPTSAPSLLPSVIPSNTPVAVPSQAPSSPPTSTCSIKEIYGQSLYAMALGHVCVKFDLFTGGTMTAATNEETCNENVIFDTTVYSIFDSASGNTATYTAVGSGGFNGRISTVSAPGVTGVEIISIVKPQERTFDIQFRYANCHKAPSLLPSAIPSNTPVAIPTQTPSSSPTLG